ncbi:MAG: hypothetical protein ACLUI3_17735 [Christensenellales bacterium]
MELLFSARLKTRRRGRRWQAVGEAALTEMGRALLDTALTLNTATARQWFDEALPLFTRGCLARGNNLARCMALRLTEAMYRQIFVGTGIQ